jgi:hypothetical protein
MTVAEIAAAIATHLDFRSCLSMTIVIRRRSALAPGRFQHLFTLDIGATVALGHLLVSTYHEASKATCDRMMRVAPSNWREAFPGLARYSYEHFDYAAEDAFFERLTRPTSAFGAKTT